jgi:hypothetical protein
MMGKGGRENSQIKAPSVSRRPRKHSTSQDVKSQRGRVLFVCMMY